jgi:hypothetical protein
MKKILFVLVCSVALVGCKKNNKIPELSTIPVVYNTSTYSYESGGVINSPGGSGVTIRGVCWSTSPNPTIANDTTINGSGTGTFSSTITGLQPIGTYYVRAYATNINGTAYGDEISFIAIGSSYQGGIVFYLDGNGGGLIAAPSDQSTGAEWGCDGTDITGADGTTIGTGYQNTIDIVNANCSPNTSGNSIAANLCANLTLGGYSDWFLPSIGELNLMYTNIGQGNVLGLGNLGGFANNNSYYWSSSESGNDDAWKQNFTGGNSNDYYKSDTYNVRAVRAF